jgi:hypothetical protein
MTIIIEGIDASGKSTLAKYLSIELGLTIQESEGPPKYRGELDERIVKYFKLMAAGRTLFVRHPCVSQPIYGLLRVKSDAIDPAHITEFYGNDPFFIYCDPGKRGLSSHEVKPEEDPEHVAAVEEKYALLLVHYRMWAMERAHLVYRIGDDVFRVAKLCRAALA